MIAIIIEIMRLLLEMRSLMIIHLGRKPVRGGSPPKDIREIKSVKIIIGILFHRMDRDSVVVMELNIIVVNMHRVNIM
ncbi:hypothetical protein NP303_25150 [Salmonella enterica]|nr:hypothetical protein [Salmonella enterica]MCQ7628143.1 hypothetical protein [Salmonella enterica]MCQ8064052.1 hypothetical protein [Salmonella enterica]